MAQIGEALEVIQVRITDESACETERRRPVGSEGRPQVSSTVDWRTDALPHGAPRAHQGADELTLET